MISTEAESKKALVKFAACYEPNEERHDQRDMYEMGLMDRLST